MSRLLKLLVILLLCLGLILCQADCHSDKKIPIKEKNIVNDSNLEVNAKVVDPLSTLTPSIPLHLTISAIGVDHSISEYTNEMVAKKGSVDPDSWNSVAWWSGGGRPGTTLNNTSDVDGQINFTTYLYGHSTNCNTRKVIFDDIDLLKAGDKIVVTTNLGQFTYSVNEVFIIAKTNLMTDSRTTEDIPGRLLLISCWRSWSGSGVTTDNVVVVANLINFVPNN